MKILLRNIAFLFMLVSLSSCGYNNMVGLDEEVQGAWAQVENAYQRRADLIPNLVNTVKGVANFEKETLTGVIEARAKATSVNIDASNLTAENIKQFESAQKGLSGSLSRLLVAVERYPELKANKNFLELQAQLEGTENRISVERQKFNDTVRGFNTFVRSFPQVIYSGIMGFGKKAYFEGTEGTEQAPEVEF